MATTSRPNTATPRDPDDADADRLPAAIDMPLWATRPATILLIAGGLLALIGPIGLLRLQDFYARMHPPTWARRSEPAVC